MISRVAVRTEFGRLEPFFLMVKTIDEMEIIEAFIRLFGVHAKWEPYLCAKIPDQASDKSIAKASIFLTNFPTFYISTTFL